MLQCDAQICNSANKGDLAWKKKRKKTSVPTEEIPINEIQLKWLKQREILKRWFHSFVVFLSCLHKVGGCLFRRQRSRLESNIANGRLDVNTQLLNHSLGQWSLNWIAYWTRPLQLPHNFFSETNQEQIECIIDLSLSQHHILIGSSTSKFVCESCSLGKSFVGFVYHIASSGSNWTGVSS